MSSSRRIKRVEELLRQEISKILLYELQDPRESFITVTGVEVSRDLKNARVGVSVLGSESDTKKAMAKCRHASGFIQHELCSRIDLRYTPVLSFYNDTGPEKSVKISQILKEDLDKDPDLDKE